MLRSTARNILRSFFPCVIMDRKYFTYESLRRKDPILTDDILDHIQWNQPIPYEIKPLCDCQ